MDVEQRQYMPAIRHISTCMVHHSRNLREEEKQCHFNLCDLRCLSIHYIQKGLLFRKPAAGSHGGVRGGGGQEQVQGAGKDAAEVIAHLRRSLAATLDHFYPLSGRLATVRHPDDGTISIFIDCNNQGAEFVHAAADVTVSDLLAPLFTPRIVRSFFPLNFAVNHDGHSLPLLSVQVTQLQDGYFIGCSMNHSVGDGTSFWHFFNSWSSIARGEGIPLPPAVDRWFPEPLRPPLRLPWPHNADDFIKKPAISAELEDAVLHFPRHAIAALKAMANAGSGGGDGVAVSSLQALLAHAWRATTRARRLPPDHATVYCIAVGFRQRLRPPAPPGYLGNLLRVVPAAATAGEVLDLPLGKVAGLLNRVVASQTDAASRSWLESVAEAPVYLDGTRRGYVITGSSPRFDVYGNDFGWGRPVAVRSGVGNKVDGKLTIYPGADEEGSMELEMSLPPEVLLALMADDEFMAVASRPFM